MAAKRTLLEEQTDDPASQRKTQGALYAEEVKVRTQHSQHRSSCTTSAMLILYALLHH